MSTTETPAEAGKQAKTVLVKITRKEGHRHAGQLHALDAVIPVSVRDAEIIVDRLKVGERVKGN
ncbi:hypothetical protein [Ectopseudomonas hydrolytica]|uniref:hypothetical protein n=1 Tax=Ectopseudomonas hydrolytica TaxID=2493633 RepID=UPI00376F22B8